MRITIGTVMAGSSRRRHHARGQRVAAQNTAEDIDQHRLHGLIGKQNPERVLHLLRVRPPPTSRKFAGMPPAYLMMSMVAMASPAPFTMHAILPSSLM